MKKILLFLTTCALSLNVLLAQSVRGTVTGEDGQPIQGVAVLVQGTTVGMFTDVNGNYALDVPASGEVLVFTFVGKKKQEVAINGRSVIDVTMEVDILEIDEVVVTAVGLESNRKSLGYSVQNVDATDIVNAREVNLVNALNSKVAGVTVVSSAGSPGASANIRVRGSTSINGSNSPLFVVDGVPIDNNESGNGVAGVDQSNRAIDINPNDIESLTVLKGAAATALYGIRAANGAIIITTKSGVQGKPKVTISAAYSFDEYNKMPERQNLYGQGRPSGGEYFYRGPETAEGFSWGPAIADLQFDGSTDYPYSKNGRLVAAGSGVSPAVAYDPYDFFVTGNTSDYNASVTGGTQNFRYYISGGRLYSEGIVPNATFQRNSFKIKVDTDVTEKLTVGMSANFVNSGGNRIQRGSNLRGVMLGLMRTTPTFDNGNGLIGQAAADSRDTYLVPDGTQRSYRAGVYDNPYWTVNKNPFRDNVNRIIGYTTAKYQFTSWLSATYKLGIDFYTDRRNSAIDIIPSPFGGNWNDGSVAQSFQSSRDLNSDFLLQFNKTFSDFTVAATVGHNYFDTKVITQSSNGTTLAVPDFYHISNATDITSAEGIAQKKLIGAFGTIDLSYGDYLFVNLTGRNDWSSSLPEANNSFQSYSASLGWAFTEMFNMSDNAILPYGKLRVSYGQVGNDAPIYATSNYFNGAFAGGDGFITGITFPAYGLNAFERSTVLGNDQLKAETTTTLEIGGELKFFNNRFGIDVTYYDSESRDQVITVQVPAPTGFTSVVQNAGVITNTGWEITGNVVPVRSRDFTWDIDVNFTTYKNTVVELAEGIEEIGLAGFVSTSSRVIAGQPYGAIFGNGFQRDDNGNLLIDDNGYPLQDPNKTALGDPNPDFVMGIRNGFNFKGLSLSVLFDIREGGDMWCGTCGVIDYFGTSAKTGEMRTQSTTFEGVRASDGAPNTTPIAYADPANGLGAIYWVRYGFGGIGEMSLYDTSWRRLREVTLSYSLPTSALNNLPFGEVSISVYGRNLWLDTDYPGIDPETNLTGASNGFGLDYFNMPNAKSYGATLRVSF